MVSRASWPELIRAAGRGTSASRASGDGGQALVEDPQERVDVARADVQAGRDAEHVPVEAALADEDAAPFRLLDEARGGGGGRLLRGAIGDELDPLHESHAADVADERLPLLDRLEAGAEPRPHLRRVLEQPLLLD